ncbi:molybdenum cofactor synthesis domain-containing protein [Archangium gephyra]|uniref:Molybdenum cofactor synthesis domain-containing protein n=1 Tax=Archangium gephyra TaxID=48 RepID=A0AAC8Q9S8_9BACT|nr:competence/damage-inducible protein A [Archangium gephyra]AKJ03201.1 Molybdopterin binding protein [Archangium gephyra]REG22924.1 molybdenum cofactor synthesis domain-containing protein [Archangium gephyra]
MEPTGAAAVIIGNEVLTAKVVDANGPHLIKRLREVGIPLRTLEIVPDEVDLIVEAVARARLRAKYVFTSGGIGPTHDDVTVRAVALAMGRKVVRLPEMVALIREKAVDAPTAEAMRLADAPEGAVLLAQPGSWYPVLTVEDVFMLPGVPQLFRTQLEAVLAQLRGTPMHLRVLYLNLGESAVAAVLDRVALDMPHVAIGSYPMFDRSLDYAVKVTVESVEPDAVEQALARLQTGLPAGSVVRTE